MNFIFNANIEKIVSILKDLYIKRKLIYSLSINDFKKTFSQSYLGIFWAFAQPMINIGVLWFVFSVGFRTGKVEGVPFILWLMTGLIPWEFFTETFSKASGVLYEYSFMLKQMVFRPIILPIIKIVSGVMTQLFFLIFIIVVSIINGFKPSIYYLQIFYYLACYLYLIIGLSWLFSSIRVFLPDIGEVINIILRFGMWLTPILWDLKMVPEKIRWLFKLNPIFYIVQGYRETFIYKIGFWHHPKTTIIFFIISTFIFILGIIVFQKLKPHFNDML